MTQTFSLFTFFMSTYPGYHRISRILICFFVLPGREQLLSIFLSLSGKSRHSTRARPLSVFRVLCLSLIVRIAYSTCTVCVHLVCSNVLCTIRHTSAPQTHLNTQFSNFLKFLPTHTLLATLLLLFHHTTVHVRTPDT